MAKNKKQKKHLLTGKIVIIIIILIFLLLVFGYYQKNRPNYRDLDKTYKKLVIPSDWKLVSKTEKKGTWGLFCWDGPFDTSPCPMIYLRYVYVGNNKNKESIDNSSVHTIAKQIGSINVVEHCGSKEGQINCRIDVINDRLGAQIMTGHDQQNNKYLDIDLGSMYSMGISENDY